MSDPWTAVKSVCANADLAEYQRIACLRGEAATYWLKLHSDDDKATTPAAVSFVFNGKNTLKDRGRADLIARTFTAATGVACQSHVLQINTADADDPRAIRSVAPYGTPAAAVLELLEWGFDQIEAVEVQNEHEAY